jgi:hypothetical protein
MNLKFPVIFCLALLSFQLNSAILCPPDKYLTCHDDIHYLPLVGMPTVLGGSGQLRYFDQSPNNACNVGHITRTWYLDYNGNQSFDTGEHACVQNIYVSYTPGTVTIDWPADIVLDCKESIPNTNPTWVSGPCDIIGVSKYDQIFGTDTKSCYKILRYFTVINWCTHIPGTNIGKWTHTQVIKIDDPSRPVIKNCDLITLGTDVGCQANFALTNSATDISPCGQQKLLWTAEVDLWSDGSIEYTFAHNHPDTLFRLDTVGSGKPVKIKLPFPVIRGYHKVTWSVHDQCGNAAVCEQKVLVKDDKKPTPYLHEILSASFEGNDHPLKVPARIFNIGSFDNCTKSNQLRFSFSPNVNDTIRIVNCNNAGFQFYTIYVTDWDGNQEQVDAFMLVYDNGACSNTLRLAGKVTEADQLPLSDVQFVLKNTSNPAMDAMAYSDQHGQFNWENISLYRDMEIQPSFSLSQDHRLDIADLKMLQDYIFGKFRFSNLQYLAADLDDDKNIRIKDLEMLRDRILNPTKFSGKNWNFGAEMDTLTSVNDLKSVKNNISLSQTNGSLSFQAVYLGDISDANKKQTGNRAVIDIKERILDSRIEYTVSQPLKAEGLQLAMKLPAGMRNADLSSSHFTIPANAKYIDHEGIIRLVITKPFDLEAGDVLFTIDSEDISQTDETPQLYESSKMLSANYQTSRLRIDHKMMEDIDIYPNPSGNSFKVDGKVVRIIDIKNPEGRSIPFVNEQHQVFWNVSPGIYYITVDTGKSVVTKKLIRI